MSDQILMWLRRSGLILCASISFPSFAQIFISGSVTDRITNDPLIGATVIVKGTTTGAVVDINGKFELRINQELPITLEAKFVGYLSEEIEITDPSRNIRFRLSTDEVMMQEVEVVGDRIDEKQKQAPLTVESMDMIGIRETPAANFYDGLGTLKDVDLTAASLGFKIINTRGFNSTSPVRSLQLIDGVDNQAPGLNFSLGNFLGASELDVMKVDLVMGASSAYYGPGAFNGVIDMTTKDPFLFPGISASIKVGERSLFEAAVRYAQVLKNKEGQEKFAYKLNISYMRANDWEADNLDPTEQSHADRNNPGGYDAVNRYGDEEEFSGSFSTWGLGSYYRDGYEEKDLVDYNTENYKANLALHYKLNRNWELIGTTGMGGGTTVYQGDNRFSLKDIMFFQHKLELKRDDFFVRGYYTHEDAGNSYDAVFTAFQLHDMAKDNLIWSRDYRGFWQSQGFSTQVFNQPGFPQPQFIPGTGVIYDRDAINQWYLDNHDLLSQLHAQAAAFANSSATTDAQANEYLARLIPGTAEFEAAFKDITSRTFSEGGTRFFDKSALWHVHAEKKHKIGPVDAIFGGNFRQYRPNSRGNIFSDTTGVKITNSEFGVYIGGETSILEERIKLNASVRMDKNQNFDAVLSPAASVVYMFDPGNIIRFSFSSAVRNPTLQDQYLYYNVGRAILLGNLNGVDGLVTIPSLLASFNSSADTLEYFDIAPIQPEKVQTFEIGIRNTIFNKVFLDASYYYSIYNDFIGYNIGADVTVSSLTNQVNYSSIQVYRVAANATEKVVTQGFSIGLHYYLNRNLTLSGNYSWNKLISGNDDPIIPAFNTPEHKFNIGFSGRDMVTNIFGWHLNNWGFSVNYKWIEGHLFEGSPQFSGSIPSYDMIDAQINKRIPSINCTFKLGASNLLNKKVYQVYGGPRVGRLAYFSVVYELTKR